MIPSDRPPAESQAHESSSAAFQHLLAVPSLAILRAGSVAVFLITAQPIGNRRHGGLMSSMPFADPLGR